MIVGVYDESKSQVTVDLTIFGANGDSTELTATVDTGFTGFLTLLERIARELRLRPLQDVEIELADGGGARLQQFDAKIERDGRQRSVPVYAPHGEPLVGMKLLRRHLVTLELIPEGSITIERAAQETAIGRSDDLPEQALYRIDSVDEVVEKALILAVA